MSEANNTTTTTANEGGTPQQQSADYIKLKVVGQDSNEVHFRVKYSTSMGKLKKAYAERTGINLTTLRFLFDGRRVEDDSTPKSLEMEDDDVIEVFQEQVGGADAAVFIEEDKKETHFFQLHV